MLDDGTKSLILQSQFFIEKKWGRLVLTASRIEQ